MFTETKIRDLIKAIIVWKVTLNSVLAKDILLFMCAIVYLKQIFSLIGIPKMTGLEHLKGQEPAEGM